VAPPSPNPTGSRPSLNPFASKEKSLPTLLGELWELVLAYLKQETLEPVKGLGRFVAIGSAGALLLALGLVLLALAALRALQVETGPHLTGNWSWVPYLGPLAVAVAAAGAAGSRIGAERRRGTDRP
jgi:hypothetical protein